MRFDETSDPNIPSEMSFDIPVWSCSQIFLFCFAPQSVALVQIESSQFRKKLLLLLFGCLLSFQHQKSRNYFYLFFCWQAFFCTAWTTCWCLAQLFPRHNVKMKFSKFVHLLLFFFFFLKAAPRVRKHERNTCRVLPPRPCSQSLCCNRFMNFWFIKGNFVDQSCGFFFLKKRRNHVRFFMITNAALMRSRCGLHVASRI